MWILRTAICNAQNNEVVPQVEHMGPGYDWDAPESVTRIRTNAPLSVTPNMRAFHLDPVTYLTDVVRQGYIYTAGLLASDAFYSTLRGFTLQAHHSYPAEVVYHGQVFPYVWVHMTEHAEDRLDFEGCRFAVRNPRGDESPVTFENHDQLRERCRDLVNTSGPMHLVAHRLVFRPQTPRYDLFAVLLTERVFFVSDGLAEQLRQRRFTGFELEPARTAVEFEP